MSCELCRGYVGVSCPACGSGMVECPECHGTGEGPYYAFNTKTRRDVKCTETAWHALPATEDAAVAKGEHYCKQEHYDCPLCGGLGEIDELAACV